MGARWYDGQLGRWTSADSIIPDPANPQSLNRFSYVEGNPLRFVDPTGHAKYGGDDYDPADEYWIWPTEGKYLATVRYGVFDRSHLHVGDYETAFQRIRYLVETGETGTVRFHDTVSGGKLLKDIGAFEGVYEVSGSNIMPEQVDGVCMAIYQDWSLQWEEWQGTLGPFGADTSFAIEDLPSHYVGAFAELTGVEDSDVFNAYLGGVTATSQEPSRAMKNHDFSPLVPVGSQGWTRQSWPNEMDVAPITDSSLWRPTSFTQRIAGVEFDWKRR